MVRALDCSQRLRSSGCRHIIVAGSSNMRNAIQTTLLIGVLAARSSAQQPVDRLQPAERLFLHPQDRPEIIPPGVLDDRDPVRVDPQHFRVDFQNERVRVVRLTMKGSESSPMHEEPDALAVCLKGCHVRLIRPDGKIQDLHMQTGDTRWVWEDTRSEKNLGTEPLEMLLIELKAKHPTAN
jgi:hypothetical protein